MRGVTLIECLMYIALLALMITSSHACFLMITHSAERTQAQVLVLREGIFVYDWLSNDVYESLAVIETGSGIVAFKQPDEDVRITLVAGQLWHEVNGRSRALTSPDVHVRSFTSTVSDDDPAHIKIEYELDSHHSGIQLFSYMFYL